MCCGSEHKGCYFCIISPTDQLDAWISASLIFSDMSGSWAWAALELLLTEHLLGALMQLSLHAQDSRGGFFLTSLLFFYWSVIDLQCSVTDLQYCYTTVKWLSYIYVLFHILSCCGLSQDVEWSSLCYIVGTCWSILYTPVCICSSQTPFHPSPASLPLGSHKSVLYFCDSVS